MVKQTRIHRGILMILGALSREIREYYDLPTVCIIQDPLTYQGFNGSKVLYWEEFRFTEEDTRHFEEVVATYPNMYFVLSYKIMA